MAKMVRTDFTKCPDCGADEAIIATYEDGSQRLDCFKCQWRQKRSRRDNPLTPYVPHVAAVVIVAAAVMSALAFGVWDDLLGGIILVVMVGAIQTIYRD